MCRQAAAAGLVLALAACGEPEGGRNGGQLTFGVSVGDGGSSGESAGESSAGAPESGDEGSTSMPEPPPDPPGPTSGEPPPDPSESTGEPDDGVPFDLDAVIWLHDDVSDWPETIDLAGVTVEGGTICLDHDISQADPAWPIVALDPDTDVVANPWVFIEWEGAWYGATWEWLRPDQTCKNAAAVAGDHIKQAPFDAASGWTAQSGETYYFMVSGLARIDGIDNVAERSNIVELIWP